MIKIIILTILAIYTISFLVVYGIALAYFEHLRLNLQRGGIDGDADTEEMAFSLAHLGPLGFYALFKAKNFKYCGFMFIREYDDAE